MARQKRNPVPRVFKFCFDASRLGSFKREQTLFRLLHQALGDRPDIARLHEVNLEVGPFFLESDYIEGGNLREWAEADGRLAALPLEERLRLVAAIAAAVAAAHSVGIIHKDLKPTNVLMRQGPDRRWQPILADFGIGAVADRSQLKRWGITESGFTHTLLEPGSSRTGTRMYQPPEANLARPATVQGDVYALGVMLYQMVISDFDQPLGHGWERRLDSARERGSQGQAHREGEAPSEPRPQMLPAGANPSGAIDPSGELTFRLLRDDIGVCVEGDSSARLASVAQLVERLHTMDKRVADALARRRAERAALRMRRLRAALATSITALIVVGGLGAFAFTEWRLAEKLKHDADQARKTADENAVQATNNATRAIANEQRAEENEKKARANAEAASRQSQLALDTLNAVIFDIQDSVENLSESSPFRRRLLVTSLACLEKLSGEFVRRSAADRHTAFALLKMGDLVLQFGETPRSQNGRGTAGPGGELSGAAESARRFYTGSLEIFQALARADPNDAQARRDLAISYGRLGDVHLKLGATDEALQYFQKDLELSEALARADPNDAQARRDLAISYSKLDDVHLRLGATDKALQSYQDGLKLSEALAEADLTNVQAQQDLSRSYYNLGKAHERANELARAQPWYEKMLAVGRDLAQRSPRSSDARREVAVDCERLSGLCSRAGDWTAAATYARQAIDHAREAQKLAGADRPFRWDFSVTLRYLGKAQAGAGQLKEARQSYEEAVQAGPKSAEAHNALAWLLATCWEDSVRDGKRAVEVATKLCELTAWKDSNALDTLAAACAEANQYDDAVKWQKKVLERPDALSHAGREQAKARLKLYEAKKPYREPRTEPARPSPKAQPPSR